MERQVNIDRDVSILSIYQSMIYIYLPACQRKAKVNETDNRGHVRSAAYLKKRRFASELSHVNGHFVDSARLGVEDLDAVVVL